MHKPDLQWGKILFKVFGRETNLFSFRLIAGGALNSAAFLDTDKGRFLIKTNAQTSADIFEKEVNGLDLLRQYCDLKIPKILASGKMENLNYLLMEWIPSGKPGKNYWEDLGRGLAELHRTSSKRFGFEEDNYISVLPQVNREKDRWPDFFVENRLEKMLALAVSKGLMDGEFLKKFRKIHPQLTFIFPEENPSLLHGDLWSGNVLVTGDGRPCLIDPAVYFGHREMDLAFSRLFGGFSERFYRAYQDFFPVEPGFDSRKDLYNLYPLLVHLNLFGKSYFSSLEKVIKKFVD